MNDEMARLVAQTVSDIRDIEAHQGVSRDSLSDIESRLLQLAAREDLFHLRAFPPPPADSANNSTLYRLSEDDDHRFALYANAANGSYGTPAHNHTTWAVIVGVCGEELNRFYERTADGGVRETGGFVVAKGAGCTFLPEDLHSIHIAGPLLNFHMYGLALEQLHERQYYRTKDHDWRVFPPHAGICEARVGRT